MSVQGKELPSWPPFEHVPQRFSLPRSAPADHPQNPHNATSLMATVRAWPAPDGPAAFVERPLPGELASPEPRPPLQYRSSSF